MGGGTERNEDEEQFSKGYHHDLSGFRLGVSYKMKLLIKHHEGHNLGQNPLILPPPTKNPAPLPIKNRSAVERENIEDISPVGCLQFQISFTYL